MKNRNALILICLALCISQLPAQPDLLFYNGCIITMEGDEVVEAISIKGEKILQLGSNKALLQTADDKTIQVNLQGQCMIPGFVDPHMHLFQNAVHSNSSLEEVQNEVFSYGITSVGEAFVDEVTLTGLREFDRKGGLMINIDSYLPYNNNCNEFVGEWFLDYSPEIEQDQKLRVSGIKIFTDGGTCGLRAALSYEYPNGGFGDLFLSDQQLLDMYRVAHANNYPIMTHAQGDVAINQVHRIHSQLLKGRPNHLRHRLDHASFNNPETIELYGKNGIIPVVFGAFPTCAEVNHSAISNAFGETHLEWLEDWRLLHDANPELKIAWKSDAPHLTLNTMEHLYSLVTKKQIDSETGKLCNPPEWLASHTVTVTEALKMMTIHAAHVLHRDQYVGSLAEGKYADLVILNENPLEIDPEKLLELSIQKTYSKGSLVYCLLDHEGNCPLPTSSSRLIINDNLIHFKNPVSDLLRLELEWKFKGQIHFQIISAHGKIVFHDKTWFSNGNSSLDINLSDFNPGTYILQIKTADQLVTKKIIVVK